MRNQKTCRIRIQLMRHSLNKWNNKLREANFFSQILLVVQVLLLLLLLLLNRKNESMIRSRFIVTWYIRGLQSGWMFCQLNGFEGGVQLSSPELVAEMNAIRSEMRL